MGPLITLSSDFAVQSQGVGAMEAVAFSIAPQARVIHLMHEIPGFDVIAAARTMETVRFLPIGFHVCVVDPGVGTARRPIAMRVGRGDYFIGPDNGLFFPAARLLGGIQEVHELRNPEYMRLPVSPIFHGRDIFTPAAAHLAAGVTLSNFGPSVEPTMLVSAPYTDAIISGRVIQAQVIYINHFGSVHLNILDTQWDGLGVRYGASVWAKSPSGKRLEVTAGETFGNVPPLHNIIMKDDYGRVEMAKNLGSFISDFPLKIGDVVELEYSSVAEVSVG